MGTPKERINPTEKNLKFNYSCLLTFYGHMYHVCNMYVHTHLDISFFNNLIIIIKMYVF